MSACNFTNFFIFNTAVKIIGHMHFPVDAKNQKSFKRQNLLIPDKLEALLISTANRLNTVTSSVSSMSVAGVSLEIKVLGVALGKNLMSLDKHVSTVVRSCTYHVIPFATFDIYCRQNLQ